MNRLKISLLALLVLWFLPAACGAEQYALLIGLDNYPKPVYNLTGSIADLHGVAAALQTNCGYRPKNIQFLTGEGRTRVTRQEILDAVARMAARIHPDDTLFFFWSGHGAYLDGQDRVAPYDIDVHSLASYRRTTLPVQEMVAPLLQVHSKALMLFFNMCREDAVGQTDYHTPSTTAPAAPPLVKANTESTGPQLTVALYSSREGHLSFGWREKRRSIFGYYLEQGLLGAAADAQGEIHFENLARYVSLAVPGRCWRLGVQIQLPYGVVSSLEAARLPLASGLPPGKGGATAVPMTIGESVEDRFDAAFQAGAEQMLQQHFAEAQVKFEEAFNLKPDEPQIALALADADMRLQHLEEAERYYRQALKFWPQNGTIVFQLAAICMRRNDKDGAEKLFLQAIALNPKAERPVVALADFYADIKHDDLAALQNYMRAIQLDANDPHALNGLGRIYLRLNNPRGAENIFRKIMEDHPDDGVAVGNLAYLYYSVKKDVPEAERLYLQAIAVAPNLAWIQNNLGWLYYHDKKDLAAAEKCFRKALELNPNDNQTGINLACVDYDRKDYNASEALFRQALTRDPRNVIALYQLGTICFIQANYAEAEKFYHQTLEINPKHALAVNGLANVCRARKEYAAAEALYRKAIDLDASQAFFHINLAACLLDDTQKDAAIEEAKKALEMGYKDSPVFAALGLTPK